MAYLDYSSELVGTVPKFSFLLAQKAVNRALREIYESRHWGFLMSEQYLIVPDAVQTGSFAVTQYNNQVQANAAAIAALNNLNNPLITKRQFRAGQSGIYNITAYDNVNGLMTLDRPFLEATAAASSYLVFKCYYDAPMADFMRYIVALDQSIPRYFKLRWDRQFLDRKDPQRSTQSDPYVLASFKTDPTTNVPIHEMWPQPTVKAAIFTLVQRRGTPLVNPTDAPPPAVSDDLLMYRAKIKAYEWAMANVGRVPELRGVSWQFLIQEADAQYRGLLKEAQRNDEENFQNLFIRPSDSECYMGPIDGKYLQSHDGPWWYEQ
jgi:hypothetical protein